MHCSLKSIMIAGLLVFSITPTTAQVVVNSLDEIEKKEGLIEIELVREWDAETTGEHAMAFFNPLDLAFDKEGNLYILDSGNNRIQVFTLYGEFIRSIGGKQGRGPGEFNMPSYLEIDDHDNLLINDPFNKRIQILSTFGKYSGGFNHKQGLVGLEGLVSLPDRRLFFKNSRVLENKKPLLLEYDYEGQFMGTVGHHPFPLISSKYLEGFSFCFSPQKDAFFVSYYVHPQIDIIDHQGHTFRSIKYTTPHSLQSSNLEKDRVETSKTFDVDSNGNIYLVAYERHRQNKEKKIGTMSGLMFGDGKHILRFGNHGIETNHTDLFRLLIFNDQGKILASKRLDVFVNRIKIYKNHLFLMDSFVGMKIYQYKVLFR
ncbi:6-bladed beta-propeller [Candidatus Peregrinibacteria bacterium]|nr:6-bladed beta-propeller [Candidatus Peregrinibacteria bacterium]